MCSFLKCPDDLSIIIFFIGVSIAISLLVFQKTKNKMLFWVVFSCLSNGVLFLVSISGSLIFRIYHIELLQYFSIFLWPVINIFIIILYFKKYANR